MSKLQDLQKRYNDLAGKRDKFAAELGTIGPKLDDLRGQAVDALMNDQETGKEEREISKLQARSEVLSAAITRAGADLEQLAGQIAEEFKAEAVKLYMSLEEQGQRKLTRLTEAVKALEAARVEFATVAAEMAKIARSVPGYNFDSEMPTKNALTARRYNLFKQDCFDMLYELKQMGVLTGWDPEKPKSPSTPDQPRRVEWINANAGQPGLPVYPIQKFND